MGAANNVVCYVDGVLKISRHGHGQIITSHRILCYVITYSCPPPHTWQLDVTSQRAIATSLLRKNDVTASFQRYNDVIITSCVRYDTAFCVRYIWGPKLKQCHVLDVITYPCRDLVKTMLIKRVPGPWYIITYPTPRRQSQLSVDMDD